MAARPKLTPAQEMERDAALSDFLFDLRNLLPAAVQAAQEIDRALSGFGSMRAQPIDARLDAARHVRQLERVLARTAANGALQLTPAAAAQVVVGRRAPGQAALGPDQTRDEEDLSSFVVRFADETDQAIDGLDVIFSYQGKTEKKTTDGSGIARLDNVPASFASVSIANLTTLAELLEARWEKPRVPVPITDPNTRDFVFTPDLSSFSLESDKPQTIVLKPEFGKLFAELWDKSGRVRHANRDYTISGPVNFAGTTDEDGRLSHEEVPDGDYTLTLTLKHFEGDPDEIEETFDSPLVVIDGSDGSPQVRLIGVVPRSIVAQLHMFFNTNKTFLLPTAMPSVKKLGQIYADNTPSQLLVVGHADTTSGAAYNDQLSLERAQSTIAFLKDDVDTWLKNYTTSVDPKKRWGKTEDHLMIISMPDFDTKPKGMDAVKWYQSTRSLTVDGSAGTETRTALIKEYMSLDDTSLDDSAGDDAA